jgi:short-subunit dehydrogenase
MNLQNKTAVVTGARGGLGSLLVQALEKEGIICVAIDKEECDFTNSKDVEKLCDEIKSKYEKIDFLFNVAGIGIYKNIDDLSIEEWNDSLSINLTAPFILIKTLSPEVVINFGSGMGVFPTSGRSAYCASKFGLRGLSLSLSKELKPKNIDVVLLTLGSIMTNFGTGGLALRQDLEKKGKKYLNPSEVIEKVLEIIKSERREVEYMIYPK